MQGITEGGGGDEGGLIYSANGSYPPSISFQYCKYLINGDEKYCNHENHYVFFALNNETITIIWVYIMVMKAKFRDGLKSFFQDYYLFYIL